MDPITLIRAIESLGLSPRSYSGRGMYGRSCVGVTLGRNSEVTEFGLGVKLALALGEDAEDLDPRTDSMGLGSIIYFPNVRWPEGRKDSEDEDESDDDEDDE